MQHRRIGWLLSVVLAFLFAFAHSGSAASPVAGVLSSQGKLFVKRKGAAQFVALSSNGQLFVGDTVGTGANSKAKLLFNDGSQFGLNANSAVEITAPTKTGKGRQSFVRALSGQIWARLRPGNAVQTPSATLGVMGTLINLDIAADGATTLTVVDGEVNFYNDFGATVVNTSQQSIARPNAAPTTPVTIPNAGLIVEWTIDLNQAVIPREKYFAATQTKRSALLAAVAQRGKDAAAQPDNAAAQLNFGDALFDAGEWEKALDAWQRADRLAPRQVATLTRLGYAQLELNAFDAAQAAFASALQIEADNVQALIGTAQLQLAQNRFREAQQSAEKAIAASAKMVAAAPAQLVNVALEAPKAAPVSNGKSAEAYIVLGLALMRQDGKGAEAKAAFETAAAGEPALYRYQAHAWLSLLALAQSDNATALLQGKKAAQLAPDSALARGNLALAYFYAGESRGAEREARVAAALNPNSAAARVALGQALLARGDVDEAARVAAQAVALDTQLAPAHYLAGIAAAQRRDYRHAVSDLKESLRLAPDFLPAAAGLARVYTRMGRNGEAVTLLKQMQTRQPGNKDVLAALGEILYEQGDYPQAIATFQQAIAQAPSALAYAGLARVAVAANRLELAIDAGQKAVQLAPQVGQYHAILGQIYGFSGLEAQAERELRVALSLDPQNAFALAQFALTLQEGDPRTTSRVRGIASRQAFLLDPAISDQLLRGGIDTEATAAGGSRNWEARLRHRQRALEGDLHFLGALEKQQDQGNRPNDDFGQFLGVQELTYLVNPETNVYVNLLRREVNAGLPGFTANPVSDDRDRYRANQGILGGRRRLANGTYLWAGYLDTTQTDERSNPNRDSSFRATAVTSTINVAQSRRRAQATSRELRLDFPSFIPTATPGVFSLGAAQLRTRQTTTRLFNTAFGLRQDIGLLVQPALIDTDLVYLQLAQRYGSRLSLTGQLRYQKQQIAIDSIFTSLSPILPIFSVPPERSDESDFMPSLVANYQLDAKTQLRFLASKRSTDVVSSIFIPTDSSGTSEEQTLPLGLPRDMKSFEVDAERYLAPGSFVKFFAFRTTADSTSYNLSTFSNPSATNGTQGSLVLSDVKRSGGGVRLEHKFSKSLFGQALWAASKTTGTVPNVAGTGVDLPYHPKNQAALGLNYIDAAGRKAGLQINHVGAFLQDTGGAAAGGVRPRFPSKTYVDLSLAKESSAKREIFLKVSNLFDARQIIFNDVPIGGRRLIVGYTGRF